MQQTLSQVRAAAALATTRTLLAEHASAEARGTLRQYRTAAEQTPIAIRTNSLGPAIATLLANQEKDKGARVLADAIGAWILRSCPHLTPHAEGPANGEVLLERLVTSDMETYRAMQREAMEYAQWLKRLAQAFVVREEDHT